MRGVYQTLASTFLLLVCSDLVSLQSSNLDTPPVVVMDSARILVSKQPLSQYAVEDMDYVSEYHLYNVGDKPALRVSLDDRHSFPTQSFEIVKGQLQVRWEKIEPGTNVTHSVIVRPRAYGTFNNTAARVTYYPTEAAKEVKVGFTTTPGESYIYRFKDYDRRFSSKFGVWVLFALLALPTILVPFAVWYKLSQLYASKSSSSASKKAQ